MSSNLPGDVSSSDNIQPSKQIQEGEEKQQAPSRQFKDVMKEKELTGKTSDTQAQLSPIQVAEKSGVKGPQSATPKTVMDQANTTSRLLADVDDQLGTKGLKLKPSQKYLLRNKLSEANTNIRAGAEKLGIKTGKPPARLSRQNPVARFVSMVEDSQNQLNATQTRLKELASSGKPINPGDMLLIQVKLSKAQQELEYSSVVLSKAVDDIKTLFNIQI